MSLLVSLQRHSFKRGSANFIRPLQTLYAESCRTLYASPPKRQELPTVDSYFVPEWKDFYTRARAFCNIGSNRECVNVSQISPSLIEKTLEKIETAKYYKIPKEDDPNLGEACDGLSNALENAFDAEETEDTIEIKKAWENLQLEYKKAAESNTIPIYYIDANPPTNPFSPLDQTGQLEQILLVRPWIKELITKLHNQSRPILVIGDPGGGKSAALVGHLLFFLNALGIRVILQTITDSQLGFVFDDDGVREIRSGAEATIYCAGRPCVLLVGADDTTEYPSTSFQFCTNRIVFTSSNLVLKPDLKN